MNKVANSLPQYKNPPVKEVAFSVQFNRIEQFKTSLMGLLWEKYRKKRQLEILQEQPRLNPSFENFEGGALENQFVLSNLPEPRRVWFLNKEETQLIQVQDDRFVRNWRKNNPDEEYPNYVKNKDDFDTDFKIFLEFMKEHFDDLVINVCEITYVNIIEIEPGSRGIKDILTVFHDEYSEPYLEDFEIFSLNIGYPINASDENVKCRLYISGNLIKKPDKPALLLKMTARGIPPSKDLDGISRFFDVGHESIVRGFTSITTTKMHELWEREL